MGLLNRTSRGPIGVDVGSRWIKAAQVSGAAGRVRLEAAALIPRAGTDAAPSPAELTQLADVLERQGFAGRRIVLSAPPQSLLTATVNLPPRGSGAPLEQIARMELARAHRCDPQQLSVAFWELPQAAGPGASGAIGATGAPKASGASGAGATKQLESTGAMAVACSSEQANPLLDAFEAAGFDVVGLDVSWLALRRACAPLLGEAGDTGVTGIIDLGARSARVIALKQGVIVYERLLGESGIDRLSESLRTRLQLDDEAIAYLLAEVGLATESNEGEAPATREGDRRSNPSPQKKDRRGQGSGEPDLYKEPRRLIVEAVDALAEEVATSLAYVAQQHRNAEVSAVLLTGGGAGIRGIDARLSEDLQAKVRVAGPGDLAQVSAGLIRHGGNPAFTAALGLAMYRV